MGIERHHDGGEIALTGAFDHLNEEVALSEVGADPEPPTAMLLRQARQFASCRPVARAAVATRR